MNRHILHEVVCCLALCLGSTWAGLAAVAPYSSQWDFNGTLAATVGGATLASSFGPPATKSSITFTNLPIHGETAHVAAFTRGELFRAIHRLAPNGGGALVNRYSVIMDVLFNQRSPGFTSLMQTKSVNTDDADWFMNEPGGLGILGVYGGSATNGAWHRLILSVDTTQGVYRSYLDGVRVQQLTSDVIRDGRFALSTTTLLFADNNQETSGGFINSLQFRSEPLDDAEAAALGGAKAAGIPIPASSELRILFPKGGETLTATQPQNLSWSSINAIGLVRVDLIKGSKVVLEIGTLDLKAASLAWTPDRYTTNGNDYRLKLTSLASTNITALSDSTFTIDGGETLNPVYGQELQRNGGFEEQ